MTSGKTRPIAALTMTAIGYRLLRSRNGFSGVEQGLSMPMRVGGIYRLRFPAIGWVRVLPNPPDTYCLIGGEVGYLVETLFTKSRWWATGDGKPNNYRSPYIKTPKRC